MRKRSIGIAVISLLVIALCGFVYFGGTGGNVDVKTTAMREIGQFELIALNADGSEKWRDRAKNSLADEGESIFLDCNLRATNCPSTFYMRLTDSTTPCSLGDTDTLTTAAALGEPSSNGYTAQQITRDATGWPTLALDSGDYQATSKTVTFSATGGTWGPVYCVFLGTTSNNTGKLISYAALSVGRTLADGESLQVTYKIKLQ